MEFHSGTIAPMFRRKPKDSTGQFVDELCESLKGDGWTCESHGNTLGVERTTFQSDGGVQIHCWITYIRTMIWFTNPEVRITAAEEQAVKTALSRWLQRNRRRYSNALVEEFKQRPKSDRYPPCST